MVMLVVLVGLLGMLVIVRFIVRVHVHTVPFVTRPRWMGVWRYERGHAAPGVPSQTPTCQLMLARQSIHASRELSSRNGSWDSGRLFQ